MSGNGTSEPGDQVLDPAGQVRPPTVTELPAGYVYGVSRYADIILNEAFPRRFSDLKSALARFRPTLDELRAGGGGRTVFVRRFDASLAACIEDGKTVWGKQNITIEKDIGFDGDTAPLSRVRGHEIDMFGFGSVDEPFPGIAVEMEWNNKDPFFDRDLINFQALHHEGAIAVGVIVTRGPALQELISGVIRSREGGFKYGSSTTHWDKLVPRVNLGGGGECPLLLVGIQPARIDGVGLAFEAKRLLDEAAAATARGIWRERFATYAEARQAAAALKQRAYGLLPPLDDGVDSL